MSDKPDNVVLLDDFRKKAAPQPAAPARDPGIPMAFSRRQYRRLLDFYRDSVALNVVKQAKMPNTLDTPKFTLFGDIADLELMS